MSCRSLARGHFPESHCSGIFQTDLLHTPLLPHPFQILSIPLANTFQDAYSPKNCNSEISPIYVHLLVVWQQVHHYSEITASTSTEWMNKPPLFTHSTCVNRASIPFGPWARCWEHLREKDRCFPSCHEICLPTRDPDSKPINTQMVMCPCKECGTRRENTWILTWVVRSRKATQEGTQKRNMKDT